MPASSFLVSKLAFTDNLWCAGFRGTSAAYLCFNVAIRPLICYHCNGKQQSAPLPAPLSAEEAELISMKNSSWKTIYEKYNALLLALAAAVLMAVVLFVDGGTGLSNNGDFNRVMITNSLAFAESRGVFAYEDTFRMVFEGSSSAEKLSNLLFSLDPIDSYPSIHMVFVRLSIVGNLALNLLTGQPLDTYHIQVLGLIYLFCYAALLYLLFRSFRLPHIGLDLLFKLGCIFVLCDEGYITYFNSLYSEPVQILAFVSMAVFALRCLTSQGRPGINAAVYFLSCVVYGWSKFINIPVAALCILGVGAVLVLRGEKKRRRQLIGGGLACIAFLGAVYLILPSWMDYETNYNSVFYGILKDATPEQQSAYLSELGLPQSMAEYADSNYYMARVAPARQSEEFHNAFSRVSKFDLLFFYLRHPGYFLQKLDVAMAHSGFIRPYYLSNLDNTYPRLTFANRFGLWSALRGALPFNTWWLSLLIITASSLALWAVMVKKSAKPSRLQFILLLLTLLGSMAYHFIMPTVTNGEGDLAKHMFAFVQFIDLLLLFLLACAAFACCGVLSAVRRSGKKPPLFVRFPALSLALALAVIFGTYPFLNACFPTLATGSAVSPEEWNSSNVRWTAGRQDETRTTLVASKRIAFGSWEGRPIYWQVIDHMDGKIVLLASDPVAVCPFSADPAGGDGSNFWPDCELRAWLNSTFLDNAFTPEERALILTEEHRVLLSGAYSSEAVSGYNDFFAFHVPAWSDRGMADAIALNVTDTVRLPDIALLADISRAGRLRGETCWMETPYYNNGSMVRILGGDGYFYMRDASDSCAVRPMIVLSALSR